MMYVTISGWGPPGSGNTTYAAQAVWLDNGAIIGPGAIAKVDKIHPMMVNTIRQVTDDEVQEYLDAGKTIVDGFMEPVEDPQTTQLREAALKRAAAKKAREAKEAEAK